ncbi:TonB-dependent receptor family protein [Solimonas soli]|uniref:TonB-dependent receptor family protein n=1 Tax=Solimonas soli TaxID=413479 RepID=UPI0004BB3D7E|nr:TonB-dependent receptor [Solimonas soli]
MFLSRCGPLALAVWALGAAAEPIAEPGEGSTVVVTATRTPQAAFDVPASIDVIGGERFHDDTLAVNLSEGLADVAGLLARDRQNYAQDTQLSIRGFGTRSAFGIRGLRLYVDGIPASQPDGQGQISHFNLASAGRVEVLRGPFSALYGNSSGGVIQLFTATGGAPTVYGGFAGGSFDTYRENVGARGTLGIAGRDAGYNVAFSNFQSEGFRDHSAAERRSFNGRSDLHLGAADTLTLVLNVFDSPEALDPLGLTRAQFEAKPDAAAPQATQYDTRKSASQTQGGAIWEHRYSERQRSELLAYYGHRSIEQFLAIPIATQTNGPGAYLHSGGVVDLGTDYGGAEARWHYRGGSDERPWKLVAGLAYDDLRQHRQGYENFVGSEVGVKGALRRDEIDTVWAFDQYLQADWRFAERWNLTAGVRNSRIVFASDDHYVTARNPDDGGGKDYSAVSPVAGLMFRASEAMRLYGSYGRGFETPTFAELAYRPITQVPDPNDPSQTIAQAGLNFDLKASRSDNAELGAKFRFGAGMHAQLAVFDAETRNELVVLSNSGGRTVYGNAGRTRRQGAEAQFGGRFAGDWQFDLAYTLLDARVREDYQTCTGTPCTALNATVPAGARIPGIAESNLYGRLAWGRDAGWHAGVDVRYLSRVAVNDVNSEAAPSYAIVGLDGGYVFDLPTVRLRTFVNLDNLLDRDYIGSVIVNDGNGRYYEPGPGFAVLAGFGLEWKY